MKEHILRFINGFERTIVVALLALLMVVVLLATIGQMVGIV